MISRFAEAAAAINAAWPWFWPLVGAIFGAVVGSFANCARYRLPRGESLRHPPSRCPQCGTTLGAADLVPVVSWLLLRGCCRYCGGPIPLSSLLVEGALAVFGAVATVLLLNI